MGSKSSIQTSVIAGEEYIRCRVLGKGSYGKVYAMQHFNNGLFRVIKEMHKGTILAKGRNVADLLLNERIILSELKGCPFVVKCFAACQDDKFLYMLLEFCSGGELQYHLQHQGKFNEDIIRHYVAQISIGLDYMHTKYHVVHRDLKPENVLLDEYGYCAIIDFNMAIHCDENFLVKNPNHYVVGTLPYIAPELLAGRNHSIKVDFWSLGIMIFELAHGKRPYSTQGAEGETEKKRMNNSIKSTKLSDAFSTGLSDDLKNLITGLLEMDPEKRFGFEEIKSHNFYKDFDWDALLNKSLKPLIIPDPNVVNFKPDANVEEVFGLSKPKENQPLTEEQQIIFENWDWVAEDQEIPPPDPAVMAKNKKKKKKERKVYEKKTTPTSSSITTSHNNLSQEDKASEPILLSDVKQIQKSDNQKSDNQKSKDVNVKEEEKEKEKEKD